jgi:cytochrome P450
MMRNSAEALLETDPFSLELMVDPLPFYKALRDRDPRRYYPEYDTFFFSRFEDVWEVLRVGDNAFVATETNLPTPQYLRSHRNAGAPPFASINPMAPGPSLHSPYYEQMRQAHIAPLRPRSVARLEGFITDFVRARLDELRARGKFDAVGDYAGLTAATTICHLFGIPLANAPMILDYVYQITRLDPEQGGVDLGSFFVKLKQFLLPPIETRRAAGADGGNPLIDGLLQYRAEGGRALSDDEVADQLVCVMIGGLESVAKVTGQGLMELWKRPDQLAAVRADLAANVPVAVNEIVRFCAPAQYTFRTAHKPVEVAGVQVRAGQRVACLLHSASRDEREFDDPETFVWNRDIPRVISFGLGQHHCIGKHLALLEVRILITEFLARVDDFAFVMEEAERNPSCFQRGWIRLPVVTGARR